MGAAPTSPTWRGPKNRWFKGVATAGICLVWMSVSSALILLNKWLLAVDDFKYPMTLSGLGMLFSSVASYLCCRVFKLVEAQQRLSWKMYITHVMPVGAVMATTLAFGNIVYLYLTVAFIQMLKALTPVVTMLCTFVAGLERPHPKLVSSVVLIAGGVAAASYGELNFSPFGLALQMLAETFDAVRVVMMEVLLRGCRFNAVEGLMYMAPACCFWLSFGIAFKELGPMIAAGALSKIAAKPLLYLSAASMGFAVNLTANLTIQMAGSLTLKVLGTVKNALVVWTGVLLWAEPVTALQLAGYGVSIGGFGLYNWHKGRLQQDKQQAASGMLSPRGLPPRDTYTLLARAPTMEKDRDLEK